MALQLTLYNTIKSCKQTFEPLDIKQIKMYVCGPTVYDYAHIGNARSVVVYDILYRILQMIYGASAVKYIRNITDIDDKIIHRAKDLKIDIKALTSETTKYFHEHTAYLNCLSPTYEPKATEHLSEMIQIIDSLVQRGFAYVSNKHVYFDVSKYPNYTTLSNRSLEQLNSGIRIEIDENKNNPHDFVLWKPAEDGADMDINFDSPWGIGRPGWHIECSAMSYKYLGENFDIHGGGADLIFPHHTNEIAQSTCAFEGSSFANFWVHNGFLTVNGEKMSKSLGNFITVKDLIEKNIPGEVIRLFLMSGNYRHPLDYNDKAINDAAKTLDYWYRALEKIEKTLTVNQGDLDEGFMGALLDDMNISLAIKIINDYAKKIHSFDDINQYEPVAKTFITCANFIGLLHHNSNSWFKTEILSDEIAELVKQRQKAKKLKDWQRADEIRLKLLSQNIKIEDHPDGTFTVRKMLY